MKTFQVLGDPHLGRNFTHGVPLHRRGDREEMVWTQFKKELNSASEDYHINMGDLFDKAIVSYDVILSAASIYNTVAKSKPKTIFVILKGNHDLLRDLERASAFDLFSKLITEKNVIVVNNPRVLDGFAFFPYDPIVKAADYVQATDLTGVNIAFGHWDDQGFGSDHNVIPTKQLVAKGVTKAYSGHVHKPATFKRDGVDVVMTGSMQPYAFGEQADDNLYVEHTLESLKTAKGLENKVVRVTLSADELLEDQIDCLQLVIKREAVEDEETPQVSLGDFDMEKLFRQAFTEAGVTTEITETILARYNDQRLSTTV